GIQVAPPSRPTPLIANSGSQPAPEHDGVSENVAVASDTPNTMSISGTARATVSFARSVFASSETIWPDGSITITRFVAVWPTPVTATAHSLIRSDSPAVMTDGPPLSHEMSAPDADLHVGTTPLLS